jgi:N-acetylmuramoyl-L-alanine amidase
MTWRHPNRTVVVDYGHGGLDPGAVVNDPKHGQVTEVQVIDAAGRRIFERIKTKLTMRTYGTRNTDKTLRMDTRVSLVNRRNPDVVLSLHANVSPRQSTRGMWLIYDDNTDERGIKLAECLRDALKSAGFEVPVVTPDNTGYVGGRELAILGRTTAPACLIELGFMTNPDELNALMQIKTQTDLALAIEDGLSDYLIWLDQLGIAAPEPATIEERVTALEERVAALQVDRVA